MYNVYLVYNFHKVAHFVPSPDPLEDNQSKPPKMTVTKLETNVNEGAPVDLTLLPVSNPLQHVLGSHICGGLEVEGN